MARKRKLITISRRSLLDEETHQTEVTDNNGGLESETETPTFDPTDDLGEETVPQRKRGKTKCIDIQNLSPDSVIPIEFNKYNQPICSNSVKLQSYLGTIARNGELCPLDHHEWRNVGKLLKQRAFRLVEGKFSYNIPQKDMYRFVTQSLGKKWKSYKDSLRKKHFEFEKSDEENFSKIPPDVIPQQWDGLIKIFRSEKWETRSKNGKIGRETQKFVHTTGRKGYARLRNELEKENGRVGPIEFFEQTHKKKSGEIPEEASNVLEILKTKVTEKIGDSDGSTYDLYDLEEEAMRETFGEEHPGRVRFYGFGALPSQVYGSNRTSQAHKMEIEKMKKQMQEMQDAERRRLEKRDRKILKNKKKLKILNEKMDRMEKLILSLQVSRNSEVQASDGEGEYEEYEEYEDDRD